MKSSFFPDDLKSLLSKGLLSFPATDFDTSDSFDVASFRKRLEWLSSYNAGALFVAGGAGEFFSLLLQEYRSILDVAVQSRVRDQPIIASAGYGTRMAIEFVREAEQAGADGILLLPPYLTEASQEGLLAHISAVCNATGLGIVAYNRANCRLTTQTLQKLADRCENFVGLKDGHGDTEEILRMRTSLGDRLVFINGMPTAEIFAMAYRGMGIPTYSSAIFNFIPRAALNFYKAVSEDDVPHIQNFMQGFLLPYMRIRSRQPGYAVSIIKAGLDIVGKSAGRVRPPLSDLTVAEKDELAELIGKLGSQD